ncbi:MAG TPA: kelch repeat-containing protein [Cyclobacteriaceae bacterium]|nr:kelch repeat-containing protein [Cyclobacteriaceae bacterium]
MTKLISTVALTLFSLVSFCQSPPARWTHVMCYDTDNKVVLMFGGSSSNGLYGDLWSFSKGQWKKLSDTGPAPRGKHAFAYDEKRKVAVLFGGSGANDQLLGDTWEWNGKIWKEVKVPGPSMRDHPMAGFDPQSNTIIIRGGFSQQGLHTDSWSFDGIKWTELKSAGSAGEGISHAMFTDLARKRLMNITVEMNNQGQARITNAFSSFENGKWQPAGKFPSTTPQSIQAISSFGKGGIVMLDGDDIENNIPMTVWSADGKWRSEHLKGPAPRVGHFMVWSPADEAVILFGGFDRKNFFGDTWMWKNEKWSQIPDAR